MSFAIKRVMTNRMSGITFLSNRLIKFYKITTAPFQGFYFSLNNDVESNQRPVNNQLFIKVFIHCMHIVWINIVIALKTIYRK